NIAAATTHILDVELLSPSFRQFLCEQARDRICRTARRVGNDHAHGSVGVALCPRTRNGRPRCRAAEQRYELAPSHVGYPRPTDHELRIAGLEWISERASQQKAVPLVRVGSVASHPDLRDAPGHVRYASNSDPIGASQRSVATCQDRT